MEERMERGSADAVALEATARNTTYGQWVAARYYPVVIVQELPDGSRVERRAALPEVVDGWEEKIQRHRRRSVDGPCRSNRPPAPPKAAVRRCAACGRGLGRYQRKYCSEECRADWIKKEKGVDLKGVRISVRVDKPCAVCGRMIEKATASQKYCSGECRRIGLKKTQQEWHQAHPPAPRPPRFCGCGAEITTGGWKYCAECARKVKSARWARQNEQRRRKKRGE